MIDIAKTLFIVDGATETQAFSQKIQKEFKKQANLRSKPCNGVKVKPDAYASAVEGTMKLALRNKFEKIIIIYDLEKRKSNALIFSENLKKAIVSKLISGSSFKKNDLERKIFVAAPDIMFENWIIADVQSIKSTGLVITDFKQQKYDGEHGAKILNQNMVCKYKKTIHGPKLFKAIDFKMASQNSNSFNLFYNILYS